MSKRHLPSIEALSSNDDDAWITELRLSEVREHVAEARSLLEALSMSEGGQPSSDFVQMLAQLGCRFVEIAGELAHAKQHAATQRAERDDARGQSENHLNFLG